MLPKRREKINKNRNRKCAGFHFSSLFVFGIRHNAHSHSVAFWRLNIYVTTKFIGWGNLGTINKYLSRKTTVRKCCSMHLLYDGTELNGTKGRGAVGISQRNSMHMLCVWQWSDKRRQNLNETVWATSSSSSLKVYFFYYGLTKQRREEWKRLSRLHAFPLDFKIEESSFKWEMYIFLSLISFENLLFAPVVCFILFFQVKFELSFPSSLASMNSMIWDLHHGTCGRSGVFLHIHFLPLQLLVNSHISPVNIIVS